MKNVIKEIPYLSDGEIYSIWKYLNGFRLPNRNEFLNFNDITALNENGFFVSKFFSLLKDLGFKSLKGLTFEKDAYLKYYKKTHEELTKKKESGSLGGYALKHLEFLEKISNDPNTLYNDETLGIFDFIFYINLGFLEFFTFSTDLPQKDKEKLSNFINSYIKNFINDNLQKETRNFYCFNEQKKNLLIKLYFLEKKYGSSFILKYPEDPSSVPFDNKDEEYLFIHTLIALETLGYFEIENIWIFDFDIDLAPDEQTENYKVKLTLKEKFLNEGNAVFIVKKKIETKEPIKKDLAFDDKKSILSFSNKEIKISKTRNSNGHYLLKSIFKDKNKIWEYDEIAEDWTEEYKKEDWSKYYNAGYKVNEKVAKETTIKDFLIITNKTVGINKKYQ